MLRIFNIQKFSSSKFTVALIGRTSVGKSSLFNILHDGSQFSVVANTKSITRDRKEGVSELFQVPVRLVDTAGIENVRLNKSLSTLQQKMLYQTITALSYSDVALFVVDARIGLTEIDRQISRWLLNQIQETKRENQFTQNNEKKTVIQRLIQQNDDPSLIQSLNVEARVKNVVLVANKAENENAIDDEIDYDLMKLQLGDPVYTSAVDGTGIQDLVKAIQDYIPKSYYKQIDQQKANRIKKFKEVKNQIEQEIITEMNNRNIEFKLSEWQKEFDLANSYPEDNSDFDEDTMVNLDKMVNKGNIAQTQSGVSSENYYKRQPIKLSIVGRTNVGKSTLVNALLGEERVIADQTPGTTRDPISQQWVYKGQKVNIIDTAGIDKKQKNQSDLEKSISAKRTYILRHSHVIILMIDSLGSYRDVDFEIAQRIVKEGRAIIMAVNKWDLVQPQYKQKIVKYLNRQLERKLGEVYKCPIQYLSAEKSTNIDQIMDSVLQAYDKWNTRFKIQISTGLLNDWLNQFKKVEHLPSQDGEQLKIRFIAQIKIRPPTYAVFVNDANLFKINYQRFLRQSLSKEFELYGTPVRLVIRDSGYLKEKKKVERKYKQEVKQQFLKNRRIANIAKQKLEKLRQQNQQRK